VSLPGEVPGARGAQTGADPPRSRRLKPLPLLLAAAFFLVMVFTSPPAGLVDLVSRAKPVGYQLQPGTTTITQSVNAVLKADLTPEDVAQKAKVMVAILFMAALLWATEAIPLAATDLLVGALLYLFFILPLDSISKAYMKDAVFFIFGVLAIALGVAKTGLDRRISLLLLSRMKGLRGFCFVFLPVLALLAGFLSEHALVAILVPVLLGVYRMICDAHGVKQDRRLAVLLLLGVCFAANQGGPGSPAAGGRNAVMVGYLNEYGVPVSFGRWMFYSMPYVLVVSVAMGAYMYFALARRVKTRRVDIGALVRKEVGKLGPMSRREQVMGLILAAVLVMWIAGSKRFGLGGPCVFAVVLMLMFNVLDWKDIQTGVRFEVVGLYAAACAMGVGLKVTGASLWLARGAIGLLPGSMQGGDSLIIATSVFTTVMTNFMSDGATVAALGPVVLSMAEVAAIHPWKIGFACAFSSSFANALIIGTPNNAIAYVAGVDPRTGERLLRLRDFLIYGVPATLIACVIFWFWAVLGYWRWMPWP
jgi:sodium-dependent dicarboxylate transporter 2/3/5